MTDLMPKEFYEAFRKHFGFGQLTASANADAYQMLKAAEWAWQASRECLVVELPNRFDEKYQDYYDDVEGGCFNEGRYINDVHAALTAAGVKYK